VAFNPLETWINWSTQRCACFRRRLRLGRGPPGRFWIFHDVGGNSSPNAMDDIGVFHF
jgi:hypothetical protein